MATTFDAMMKKAASADGFLAALDQSGGSTPKALKGYGVPDDVSATISVWNFKNDALTDITWCFCNFC